MNGSGALVSLEDGEGAEDIFECERCGKRYNLPSRHKTEIFTDECECCKNNGNDKPTRHTVLRKLNVPVSAEICYDGETFKAKRLADLINDKYHFLTFSDSGEIWQYDEGIYVPGGETTIQEETERILGEECTTYKCNEVVNHIKRMTYLDRDEINIYKELLCVGNGVLNLQTGDLHEYNPKRIFLNKIPVKYDSDAECPRFKQFISEVVTENDIPIIQEMLGYCLWREYHLAKAFILVGEGRNGKSTLLNVINELLGERNISGVALQDLDGQRFTMNNLYGKMANIYNEIPHTRMKSTGKFKMLTGGDPISAEKKYVQEPVQFHNYAKLLFSCNQIPPSPDDTTAYYERWIIINFPHTFIGDDADSNLLEKLTTDEELSGLLNWALEGLHRLLENGTFSHSKTTEKVREDYIRKSNPQQAFVEDCLIEEVDASVPRTGLYQTFIQYCYDSGLPTISSNLFSRELPRYIQCERGQRYSDGKRVWHGIKVNDSAPRPPSYERDEQQSLAGNHVDKTC